MADDARGLGVLSVWTGACRRAIAEHRRLALTIAATLVALIGFSAVVPALALHAVRGRAEALGFVVATESASLGMGVVHVRGLTLSSPELPGVRIRLETVSVRPSLTLSPRRIDVHGGTVSLEGSREDLARRLDAWQDAHRASTPTSTQAPTSSVPISVDGIGVTWVGDPGDGDRLQAWGMRYDRDGTGVEHVGVDLGRAAHVGAHVEVSHAGVSLEREGKRRVVTQVSSERLALVFDANGASRRLTPRSGGIAVTPQETDEAERGPKLRAKVAEAAAKIASFLPPSAHLEIPGVRFELRQGGQSLNVGPATLVVEKRPTDIGVTLASGETEGQKPLRIDAQLPLDEGPVDARVSGGPIRLAALGINENDMGLLDVGDSELDVSGSGRLSADGRTLSLSGEGRLSNLSVSQPKLAHEPVHGLSLSLAGKLTTTLDGTTTHLEDVELGVGRARLKVRGDLSRSDGHAQGSFHVEAPLTACSDVLAATPTALVPLLEGLGMSGTFTFSGDLAFDTRRPADATVDWRGANDCAVTQIPPALSLDRFHRPWTRTVVGADGFPTTIESGPGTRDWAPYSAISPYMATAVVICEDARFFSHHGFDAKSIQSSIRDNLRTGRFVRGASTVSMQLAKNLYLAREKTLSRKLQEAVLTVLLEQSLRKEDILELYLNIVEFGPGVYGIGQAAAHYFHSKARDLSLGQALYLASILSNPKVQHFGTDGILRPGWADYLRKLMRIAFKIHKIDDRELEIGLEETVQFGVPATAEGVLRAGDVVFPGDAEHDDSPEPYQAP